MSSRLTPKDIHPSIFESVLALTGSYMSGQLTDQKSVAAATKHSNVWFAEYWKGIIIWIAGLVPVIYGTMLMSDFGKPGRVLTFFVLLSVWIALGAMGYQKNKNLLTWEELDALRPGLELSEHQALYLDCLKYVEESQILDAGQKKSWRGALFSALDQAIILEKLSEEMKSSAGGKNHSEGLAEIARLQGLADQAADSMAKQAYSESLHMAKDRLSKWDSIAAQAERTEAHLELTKQTFLKTRDTLKGLSLQQQQTVQVDLEPLRANLSRVQTDAYEIQRAIEELRQI